MNPKAFDRIRNGKQVKLYELQAGGIRAWITNYGSRIVSLQVKDGKGKEVDVVVGFETLQDYLDASEIYHGAIIGRYANRIAKGKFRLGGKEYSLKTNNGPNHLHGGDGGFHNQVWDVVSSTRHSITLSYLSGDGEEGYPGNLEASVTYTIKENEVSIDYSVRSDSETILNITNHSYFNLNGIGSGPILHHSLQINADRYTPIDANLIPNGKMEPVSGTPFDFRSPAPIGQRIETDHEQLRFGKGYDHNYVLNKSGSGKSLAACATGDKSGITMEVYTEQPGMQLYTGNFMKGRHEIRGGGKDEFRTAFCLETQHFPDSPNQPSFPSVILDAGTEFRSSTVYKFQAAPGL